MDRTASRIIATSILSTISVGLIGFFSTFFVKIFPDVKADILKVKMEMKASEKNQDKIFEELKDLRKEVTSGNEKLYHLLSNRK